MRGSTGTVICYIGKPNEKVEVHESTKVEEELVASEVSQNVQHPEPLGKEVTNKQRIKISPVAKKIAKLKILILNHYLVQVRWKNYKSRCIKGT